MPLFLLTELEATLRLAGYAYSTDFCKKTTIAGRDYLIENDQFNLRFFPASLARGALPMLMPAKKARGAIVKRAHRHFRQACAPLRLTYSGDGLKEKLATPEGDVFSWVRMEAF